MKVLVWNVRRANQKNHEVWHYFTEIAPDIALLQEVVSLPQTITSRYSVLQRKSRNRNGKDQRFSTAILVKGTINQPHYFATKWDWVNQELQNFGGNIVAAKVTLESGTVLQAVSVYSPAWPVFDRKRVEELDTRGIQLKNNPDIWLTEILYAALLSENLGGIPWLVGGDLNSSVTFDTLWKGGPRGNQEIQDRMLALGLKECLRLAQGELTPTFKNPSNKKIIHQMDHLFATNDLTDNLIFCETGQAERVFDGSLSDHLPIIAEFKSNQGFKHTNS